MKIGTLFNVSLTIGKLTLLLWLAACGSSQGAHESPEAQPVNDQRVADLSKATQAVLPGKTIHVLVALCDNLHQGIVPVPARIGNGDDPQNNLHWGAGFGVKTFFLRSPEWVLMDCSLRPRPYILERCVFRLRSKEAYLVADAYRGSEIRRCIADFLNDASTDQVETIMVNSTGGVINVGADRILSLLSDTMV